MIRSSRRGTSKATPIEPRRPATDEWRAVTNLALGEFAFLFFTGVSVALHPGLVLKWNEGGMTNYGLHIKTAVPFTLALGLLVFFSQRAATLYASGEKIVRRLRLLIQLYCVAVLGVMLSSYAFSLNSVVKNLHFVFGAVLIVVVGVSSLWIYQLWPRTSWVRLLLFIQLIGDASALLTVVGAVHFLFLAEILSNVGFAGLLIRTGRKVARDGHGDAAENDAMSFVARGPHKAKWLS